MRIYPQHSFTLYNVKEQLKTYHLIEKTVNIMLTENGFYQANKDDIFIYKTLCWEISKIF